MKRRSRTILKIFLISLSIILGCVHSFAVDIRLINRFDISKIVPTESHYISVYMLDDNLLLLPNVNLGNITVLKIDGSFISNIGSIGNPGDFEKPAYCTYDKIQKQLAVYEAQAKRISIMNRLPTNLDILGFTKIGDIACPKGAHDILLKEKNLYVSGAFSDPNNSLFHMYVVKLIHNNETNTISAEYFKPLLPSNVKYNIDGLKNIEQKIIDNKIPILGYYGWFDVDSKDNVYYCWESSLRVIQIQPSNNDQFVCFGNKTSNYVQPRVTDTLSQSYNRSINVFNSEKANFSYIKDILVGSDFVGLVYSKPMANKNEAMFYLQVYTLSGFYQEELPIGIMNFDTKFFYNRENHNLIALTFTNDDFNKYVSIYEIH